MKQEDMFLHNNQQSYEFFNEISSIIIILIISAFSLTGKGSPVGMLELMLVFSPLYKTTKKDSGWHWRAGGGGRGRL